MSTPGAAAGQWISQRQRIQSFPLIGKDSSRSNGIRGFRADDLPDGAGSAIRSALELNTTDATRVNSEGVGDVVLREQTQPFAAQVVLFD
jgi:hypothetical protein